MATCDYERQGTYTSLKIQREKPKRWQIHYWGYFYVQACHFKAYFARTKALSFCMVDDIYNETKKN